MGSLFEKNYSQLEMLFFTNLMYPLISSQVGFFYLITCELLDWVVYFIDSKK